MTSQPDHADTGPHCPICDTPVDEGDRFSPFCSDRCKTIDLGRWLDGRYVISRPIERRDVEETD